MAQLFVFQPFELVLIGIVFVLFLIQLTFYLIDFRRPYRRLKKKRGKPDDELLDSELPPVSIIIYVKNESENLSENLPLILNQHYPEFEVIVVNDGSTDESEQVLKNFELKYANLYHTFIPEEARYLSRKKLAMTVGIKAAKYDRLLFTEVNCRPASNEWIASVMKSYHANTEIVIGYSTYESSKGLFHQLAGYDTIMSNLRMMSSALCNRPFMAYGSNLSYFKSLFFGNKGYSQSLNLHAGEDDLFVNETADSQNTEVLLEPEGATVIMPYSRFKVWKEMKVSRAATRGFYRGGQTFYYRLEVLTRFLFWVAALFTAIYGFIHEQWLLGGGAVLFILIRWLAASLVLKKFSTAFGQKFNVWTLPFMEIYLPIFELYIQVYRVFRGKNDFTFRFG